jgi:hypothetical protein
VHDVPRILLVDDEYLIALELDTELRAAGYRVIGPSPEHRCSIGAVEDGAARRRHPRCQPRWRTHHSGRKSAPEDVRAIYSRQRLRCLRPPRRASPAECYQCRKNLEARISPQGPPRRAGGCMSLSFWRWLRSQTTRAAGSSIHPSAGSH